MVLAYRYIRHFYTWVWVLVSIVRLVGLQVLCGQCNEYSLYSQISFKNFRVISTARVIILNGKKLRFMSQLSQNQTTPHKILLDCLAYFTALSMSQILWRWCRTVVLYWCGTWLLTMREEHRLRVFEKSHEVTVEWRRLHNKEFHNPFSSPSIFRVIELRRMRWEGHIARMGRGEVHTGVWWGGLKERDHLEDLRIYESVMFKCIFKNLDWEAWTGLIWLRIGIGGGRLWMRQWTSMVHKKRGISWLADNRLASQEGLCSMELHN